MLRVRSYGPDVAIVDIRLPPTHSDGHIGMVGADLERRLETLAGHRGQARDYPGGGREVRVEHHSASSACRRRGVSRGGSWWC
jgi:hypothetical protein